jgi:integrase
MKKTTLTNLSIARLKPGAKRYEVSDTTLGLRLIVQPKPSGVLSWALRTTVNGTPAKITLGRYRSGDGKEKARDLPPILGDDLSLQEARELASKVMSEIRRGVDPRQVKRERKDAAAIAAANTFASVSEKYFVEECGMKVEGGVATFDREKKRSGRDSHRMVQRLVLPRLGNRPVTEITKQELRELIDGIAEANGIVAANRILTIVRAILFWREKRVDDFRAISFKGLKKTEPGARTRILNDDELRVVWRVASEADTPFNCLVRFLLLSCARRAEASAMTHSEVTEMLFKFDNGKAGILQIWTLPVSRSKTKMEVVRPLSKAAIQALKASPNLGCRFFFSTDGKVSLSAYSRFKRIFDARCLEVLKQDDPKAKPLPPWRIHDLRRTARSLLSRAGVHPDHAARCLGHAVAGQRATYDLHDFVPQMVDAFDRLADLIELITSPSDEAKVVPLRAREH